VLLGAQHAYGAMYTHMHVSLISYHMFPNLAGQHVDLLKVVSRELYKQQLSHSNPICQATSTHLLKRIAYVCTVHMHTQYGVHVS
jgi:hypothetical protein